MKKLLLLLALASSPLCAQMMTVSGTQVADSTGSLLSAGRIWFAPVDLYGHPISYRMGGGGQTLSQPVSAAVTNGILEANIKSIGIGTATLTSGSKYTVAVVLNTSTGSWTFYTFNGGSYSVDATGTNSMSFTEPFNYIGFFSGNYFDGLFVDGGYSNTAWGATALNCLAYYSYHTLGV